MCGIAGFFGSLSPDKATSVLHSMAQSLKHRGPDHQGIHLEKLNSSTVVGFAHALLSIIGKPGEGIQPFKVPGGILVFNGAIYNFSSLREDLKKKGCIFRTQTDTEVLAQGLSTEGLSFLGKTRGMYAFGFWHAVQKKLWIGRDPFGVKPLYYAQTPTGLVFASEYKAFLPHLQRAEIDRDSVYDYLRLRYVPGQATFFEQIRKVPPGCVLEMEPGKKDLREIRHFEIKSRSEKVSEEELFHLLEQAFSRRAVADVEVAALLSGGIDSALVCDVLERSVKSLHTYTLTFPGSSFDESARAAEISRVIGARNDLIPSVVPQLDRLGDLVYHLDDPYGDPIILALDRIFSFISGKQRVVVTGEGSDEIFSGYVHHRVMGLAEKIPGFCLTGLGRFQKLFPQKLFRLLFPYSGSLSERDYQRAWGRMAHFGGEPSLASFQSVFYLFDDADFREQGLSHLGLSRALKPTLQAVRDWDMTHWLPDSQLFKLDKIAMASSIEAREPFVDQDLVSAALSFSARQHFSFKTDKPILRSAVHGKVRVPEEVVSGRKSSFFQPFSGKKSGPLAQELKHLTRQKNGFLEDFLGKETLNGLLLTSDEGLVAQKRLFALGVLGLWQDRILKLQGTGISIDENQ